MNHALRAMLPLLLGHALVATPVRPVPFSQMRYQTPRMPRGWVRRRHSVLADADTTTDREAITRAKAKRSRQGIARRIAVMSARLGVRS